MYCPACGADAGDSKFCPECGDQPEGPCRAAGVLRLRLRDSRGRQVLSRVRGARARVRRRRRSRAGCRAGRAGREHRGGRDGIWRRPPDGHARQERRRRAAAPAAAARRAGREGQGRPRGRIQARRTRVARRRLGSDHRRRGGRRRGRRVLRGRDRGGSGTAASPGADVSAGGRRRHHRQLRRARPARQRPVRPGRRQVPGQAVRPGGRVLRGRVQGLRRRLEAAGHRPGRGHRLRHALFYSGKIAAALEQIDEVLAQSPEFQTAWFNKGNYLAEKAGQADKAGNDTAAKAAYAGARVAYQKAIDLDPSSSSGQQAQQQLGGLPTPSP